MSVSQRQLPVPQAAIDDSNAVELLRVWAAEGSQHVSLATGIWNDPANWGIMLVDLAKHIARAYQQETGSPYAKSLHRIKDGIDAEWHTPTDEPEGQILT
jgi:hypothetical protein